MNRLFDKRYQRYNKDWAAKLDKRDYQRKEANDQAMTDNVHSHEKRVVEKRKFEKEELSWDKSNLVKDQ